MARSRDNVGRRWLLIQLHRAQIERLVRSGSRVRAGEIARRMNAIALLCDCGRTEAGQHLAMMLAEGRRPDLQSLPVDLLEQTEPS